MKRTLSYLWQLPQNLLGLLLILIIRPEMHLKNGIPYYYKKSFGGGISLGDYIIVCSHNAKMVKHEYGHCLQSRRLGWLYLIVIGLPSIIWAGLYGWLIPHSYNGYYRFYTERWADKLGGVTR